MKTIHKYELTSTTTSLELPIGAKILHCGYQPCANSWNVWAEVDTEVKATAVRQVQLVRTGLPFDSERPLRFINTAMLPDGTVVFHFYEVVG